MKHIIYLLLIIFGRSATAQDIAYTRKMLDTLTSKTFWGRGYTNNGMANAASFIERELITAGLKPMDGKSFNQYFEMKVNSFPGQMTMKINGKALKPGIDFLVTPSSASSKGKGKLVQTDSIVFKNDDVDVSVILADKLTWSVADHVSTTTVMLLNKKTFKELPKTIDIDVQSWMDPYFKAANVCGVVKGTTHPDSLVILTAHYDHLGGMGKDTYFPGANDNASGVSFLLSMAKHYAKDPPPYSIGFIFFGAEEAGLVGSKFFTDHPLVDLKMIKFLINLDLVGTGEAGMTVVNATVFPEQFKLLKTINDAGKFMPKINSRGRAANSDHYYFSEKGVPAFFMYTQGGISAYHDVYDVAKTLPFTKYEGLFNLVDSFIRKL